MNQSSHSIRSSISIGLVLLLTLVITRSGHFGTAIKLPDASWAMFWLSGALGLRWYWPMILMVSAALVDYVVISHGVSSYCVTPAYPFLIPAYLSLWTTGKWVANQTLFSSKSILRVSISIVNGVTASFVISNISFFGLSGYFSSMSAWQYSQSVIVYWPHYLWHTAIYAITGLLIKFIATGLRSTHATQSTL